MDMRRFLPDNFLLMLLGALLLGRVLPVRGDALLLAQNVIFGGIFLLFFLHGLRLPRGEVLSALRAFRLQGAMIGFSFAVMPVAGWALARAADGALPPVLLAGIIYVAILPSTVQSAISYSSIGGGNVAASVMGAAFSNLAGIFLTPALAAFLVAGGAGGNIGGDAAFMGGDVVVKIATMLLLPFALGQVAQHWLYRWAQRQKAMLALFDRGVILLAVYIAFAGAVVSGAFAGLDGPVLLALMIAIMILLVFAFAGAMLLGGVLGLSRVDRISLIFAGAHKSIATGAPMAALLFGPAAGAIILPAIIYHMAQLIISAPVARRLSRGTVSP